MPALTKRFIDSLPKATARKIIWDSTLKGFGLLLLPSGVMTFIFTYRNEDGRQRRYTIGRFGATTVDNARERAKVLQGRIASGDDPVAIEKSQRIAPTVAELLDEYVTKHVELENSPKTLSTVRPIIDKHIKPALGRLKTAGVTRQDVLGLKRKMRATPRQANMALAILSKAFNLAEEWGLRKESTNPCRKVPRFDENERERFLSADELRRLGAALDEAETRGLPWAEPASLSKHLAKEENRRSNVNAGSIAAVRLLLLTGARLSEVLTLRWDEVDLQRGVIALPARKGGKRLDQPISSMAAELLAALPKVEGSPWVLPAPKDARRHLSISVAENAWQRLRAHAGIPDVRIHDLRHTAGTFASQTGVNAFIVRDLLRHKTIAMTGRYANKDEDPVRAVSEAIGKRIMAGLRAQTPDSDIY